MDADEPIDEGARSDLFTMFTGCYSLTSSMFLMPPDSLRGRVFREFAGGAMTLLPVKEVICLYWASLPQEQLSEGGQVLPPVKHVARYDFGLRILGNAKAITGCHKVDSKLEPRKETIFAPLQASLDYADFWFRKVSAFDVSEQGVLAWATQKDEET